MIKSLTALAIFGLLGTAVVALPGFAPRVEASETVALACSEQVWPNFDASCLRGSESGLAITEVRLVTARAK
jgi:hypothetical protein